MLQLAVLYKRTKHPKELPADVVSEIVNFIKSPRVIALKYETSWPESKGRWLGDKGYNAQFRMANALIGKILEQ